MKKKIVIVSTSRSDFSLVYQIYHKNKSKKLFNIKLLIAGSHFESNAAFNDLLTKKQDRNIIFLKQVYRSNTLQNIIRSNQIMQMKFLEYLQKEQADLVVVLGDRAEIIPIVTTSLILGIKVGHISGGEITSGSLDDRYRHAITKLSDIHFVSNAIYRDRIIQLGENPGRVIVSGPLSIDLIKNAKNSKSNKKSNIRKQLLDEEYMLLTLHPEINFFDHKIEEVLVGLNIFKKNYKIVITGPNSDPNNHKLSNKLKKWSLTSKNVIFVDNIGHNDFIQVLGKAKILIGNSSSGFTEAPLLGVPVVNIGKRQAGRIEFEGLFNIPYSSEKLRFVINKIINEKIKSKHHLYSLNHSPSLIILNSIKNFSELSNEKMFIDINLDCINYK